MPQKYRRFSLKSKESKQIIAEIAQQLKIEIDSLIDSKSNLEKVETEFGQLLLINGKPMFFQSNNVVFPILTAEDVFAQLPKAVVDMGAVRYVCNGADIMAPGIVRYEGEFSKGEIIVVLDEKHGKPLALGESLYSSIEVNNIKNGAIIKSWHYVGDKIWNLAKTIVD